MVPGFNLVADAAMTYLVQFHKNKQIVLLEIHLVARSYKRSHLFDHAISAQEIVIPQSRSNRKLHAWYYRQ
jgi:hypothetical protein